ncbi:short-chain dehydrogenase [Saccharobesus litoralis]|uniref:Short-chain dehydrogenase n=1 Tax=Saccharobesus litoralis TaxID=2172099 RepID=A0A2S0VV34_9ALTE|nr:SDR family oxidoreductase [Saccharobesus litoralis]AWB68079.1 short-chain dehydrogenase [Saccharobesus litoralis]
MLKNQLIKLCFLLLCFNSSVACSAVTTQSSTQANTQSTSQSKGTVLITGANRGLGLALSRHFIADGYKVIGTARKPHKATDLKAAGAQVVQLDVTDDESIAAMAKTLQGVAIDIVVNNAGYVNDYTRGIESFKKSTREEYLRTYNINTVGPVLVAKALYPNLLLSKASVKKLVNTSSQGGIVDRKGTHAIYAYDTSKTALNKLTNELAKDLKADNITVISLAPGWNKTRTGGEGARLEPEVSMAQAKKVIESLTIENTGTFVTYSGRSVKW